MKKIFKAGFSMVEFMVILAALGGVALIVTKLGKNSMNIQGEAQVASEYADLVREAHFLLDDSDSCKASLKDLKFKNSVEEISGIEILSSSAMDKSLPQKKVYQGRIGKLEIEKVSMLITPISESRLGKNGARAEIRVTGIKATQPVNKKFEDIKHSLNITYLHDASGENTIIDCTKFDQKSTEAVFIWCGTISAPCVSENVKVMGMGKYIEGKFTGTIHSLDPSVALSCPAMIQQSAQMESCK